MSRKSARASKRRARGAVFTELLAIMPAFIMVNMVLLHLWSAYSAKQYTMQTSRRAAWKPAVTGCQAPATVAGATPNAPTPDATLEALAGRVAQAKQHAAAPNLRAPFEGLTKQASGAHASGQGREVSSAVHRFGSDDYPSEGAVLCNEIAHTITGADEKRAVDDAWKKYIGR